MNAIVGLCLDYTHGWLVEVEVDGFPVNSAVWFGLSSVSFSVIHMSRLRDRGESRGKVSVIGGMFIISSG